MRTVAIIGRKGGSGKTTVAVHLALAAHLRGLPVTIADIDPQGSSADVLQGRLGIGPKVYRTTGPKVIALQQQAVHDGAKLMIVDTPAVLEEELSFAIVAADVSLLVVRPTFLDLAAVIRTSDVIRRLRKPGLVVLNQAPTTRNGVEPPQVTKAIEALKLMRLPVAPVVIRARAGYQVAVEAGRSVEEMPLQQQPAAQEMAALWGFVDRFIFGARKDDDDAPRSEPRQADGAPAHF